MNKYPSKALKSQSLRQSVVKKIAAIVVTSFFVSASMTPAQAIKLSDLFGNASTPERKFLSVDEAFGVTASAKGNTVNVTFDITKEHYVYRDKLKLILPKGVTASNFSFNKPATFVDDPSFGKVAVFDQKKVVATVKLFNNTSADIESIPITMKWQGCAKAGLCYPPEKIKANVSLKKKR